MGACDFYQRARGKNAQEAFHNAVDTARHEHGHGGCTGTIAEKHSYVMIPWSEATRGPADDYAQELLDSEDRRVADKWGPAGCIALGIPDDDPKGLPEYLFFGMASS